MRFFEVIPINWEDFFMETLSLVSDEEVISLSHAKVYESQILCYVLERWIRTQHQILFGKNIWFGSKIHHNTELWTQLMGSRWNSSGIFSQDWFTTLQLISKVQEFMTKMGDPSQLKGQLIFMSMFNDISWKSEDNERECNSNATLVSIFAKKDSQQDVGHSSELDQKRGGILLTMKDHKENGTESLNRWWSDSERADTQFSEPRVHCPEERSKAKEVENDQYISVPMGIRLKLLRTIISVNQLSIYGAVLDVCEEYGTCQTRTERLVVAGQADPLFEPPKLLIMTPRLSIEIPAQEIL